MISSIFVKTINNLKIHPLTFIGTGPPASTPACNKKMRFEGVFYKNTPAGTPARIFHVVSTAAAQSDMSTALRLFGLLDILSYMPSSPSLRAPCIHARLRRLATKPYEISGLTRLKIFRQVRKHLFIRQVPYYSALHTLK